MTSQKSTALKRETLDKRPTGTTAAFTTLLVIILKKAGVDLDPIEAAGIVGALTTIISVITPRLNRS